MIEKGPKPQDLTGKIFERWKVLRLDSVLKSGHRKWICKCLCGTEKSVYGHFLRSGESKSCGCLQVEIARKQSSEGFTDLRRKRFGKLVVRDKADHKNGRVLWNVVCDCGNELSVRSDSLVDGNTISCGCDKVLRIRNLGKDRIIDLVGKRFGRLLVTGKAESRIVKNGSRVLWYCKCDCGNVHKAASGNLLSGATKSCGCFLSDMMRIRMTNPNLTDEERRLNQERRLVPGIRQWRAGVYKRDHYTCLACGDDRGGNLVAHHKNSWADNKSQRLSVDNGATSCVDCHNEFHSKFGWGGNTEQQWNDFVESKQLKAVAI